jgi:hypothetical protein
MFVKNARKSYQYNSGKAGEIARQLSLAGIAVVWMFRGGIPGGPTFTHTLLLALGWFCISLALDFLQYVTGTIIWAGISYIKEILLQKQGIDPATPAAEFQVWHVTNLPCNVFLYGKLAALVIAFRYLAQHLLSQIIVT